ncbi:ABC transporter permease [Paenibacillus lignilyticus]|uniref:Sugar ABC transporter permease n=1 Tax=Paenibacillus lignilyticus TaxID=1172615 RepID=A0ABS5CJ23_9BACL|nr:ABC transporter permease subunit [Paenibacillus lignilyticus]MBP3965869.1 sugar ABC transporter permease [Paenibacillus lignilyticus]
MDATVTTEEKTYASTDQTKKDQRKWKTFKKNLPLLSMSLPGVLFKLIFSYLPLLGLIVAFKQFRIDKGIWGSDWSGFKNFEFFFRSDNAWRITRNTILYNGAFIILTMVIAILLAVLLNELTGRWVKVHQTILFLPYFISWVVIGYIVLGLLDHKNGFVNHALISIGKEPIKWYMEAQYWPFILIAAQLWKTVGFSTLVYYAGIIGIDPSYYEAARIDGASRRQMLTRITLPLLTPLIVILVIVGIGNIFRADFGLFYFVPNDSSFLYPVTDVIDTYVYKSLRVMGDIGTSTAIGLYQSVVGFVLVITANSIIRKINRDNSLW